MCHAIYRCFVSLYRRWIAPLVARRPGSIGELRRELAAMEPQPEPMDPQMLLNEVLTSRVGDSLRLVTQTTCSHQTSMDWAESIRLE
jgi:hypothetical protein